MGFKQWKSGGEEDKYIAKLINQGRVNKYTKPSTLKTKYPSIFGEFSVNVIRNHLNICKRINGLHLGREIRPTAAVLNSHSGKVATITNSDIIHKNFPVLCERYKDPDTQYEKVIMAVGLPGGAQNVRMLLNDDGLMVVIKYSWPKPMYEIDDNFKKQLTAKEFNNYHPKLLCLKNGLENVRRRIDVAPEASIQLQLPLKVQTFTDSRKHWGVKKDDGTQVVVAEFTGFNQEYKKKTADNVIIFEN